MDQVELVNHRLQRPLAQLRPGLTASQRWTLATATLSVIGSITTHSNVLAVGEIRTCMAAIASDILAADLPTARRSAGDRRAPLSVGAIAGTYEHVLYEAVRLFYGRGYRNTSMEDIATAVGIQASGLYRTFPRKAAILALAYRRAADRHSGDLTDVLSRIQDPETALTELIDAYLTRVMESPEQAYVYYTERHNLSESDLRVLDAIEHSMVDAWARLVTAARPEMRIGCARYAVCAAFVLAVDFNRLVDDYSGSESIATIRRLMEVTMLGRPAARGPRRGRR
jgi:AcrR family transcriptional regulator